ncbi:hypothetical protein Pmani_031402 [Petrolisthes manimaculis]|uniref:Uncharacterized protein n=1 Tax=Petrolisthes manimaculis TaxID=1843537 RepID=A0AAE1NVR0_9EUCA|nr:hypothetical protein Pmani_031402 [Petrolisthes manimaculis]
MTVNFIYPSQRSSFVKILTRLSMRTHLPLTSAVVNSLKFKDICASAIKETLLQSDVKITGKLSNTRLSKEI